MIAAMSPASFDTRRARLLLRELRECQRASAERESCRRLDALEGVEEAIQRIGEIGSSAGILDRAAEELGAVTCFRRILISELADALLIPRRLWSRDEDDTAAALRAELGKLAIPLAYPLIEAEIAASPQQPAVVVQAKEPRSPAKLRTLLRWDTYVVCAISLQDRAIGFLHAQLSCVSDVDYALDPHLLASYADGLARAFERASLREMLERHRHELRSAVVWMSGELAEPADREPWRPREAADPTGEPGADLLTPRETEVLGLLGRGQTNASIASSLMISESTVKFHVKNILLKLGAKSRADAVARYIRGAA
ncbi:MAG: helix-turn-helix transcriptional regulator [Solirubrobacteraceae bacterium]